VTITNDLLSDPFTSVEGRYIHRVTTLISVSHSNILYGFRRSEINCKSNKLLLWLFMVLWNYIWSWKASVPIHGSCMEKSVQHIFHNSVSQSVIHMIFI